MSLGDEYKKAAIELTKDLALTEYGDYISAFTGDFLLSEEMYKETTHALRCNSDVTFINDHRAVIEMDFEYGIYTFMPMLDNSMTLSTKVVVHKHGGMFAEPPIGHITSIYQLLFSRAHLLPVKKLAGVSFYQAATKAQLSQVYASLHSYRMPLNATLPCLVASISAYPPDEDDAISKGGLMALVDFLEGK